MKAADKSTAKQPAGRGKQDAVANASTDAADDQNTQDEGFLPKAQQLGSQVFADGTKVMEDASTFVRTVHQISQETEGAIRDTLGDRPYLILGTAATVGFILGRGLTFGMSRTLLGMGGKLAMSMLVRKVTQSALS